MKRQLLFLLLLGSWLGLSTAQAQVQVLQESFESGTGYTSNTFDLRATFPSQYFLRATLPVAGFGSSPAGADGSWIWASEGVRGQNPTPDRPAGFVQTGNANIAGKSTLLVRVSMADPRGPGSGSTIGGSPNVWENDDYIRVLAQVDGGSWVLIGQFVGDNPTGGGGGLMRRDTNLNGISSDDLTAPTLTGTFQDFTFSVAGTGSTLAVRVEVDQLGGTEEFAFDNIRVLGTVSATQAPVLANIEGSSVNYNEGDPATQITNAITVSDADSPTLVGGSVSLTTGFVSSQDALLFTSQNGISGSYSSGSGVLTLSGTATLAAYQAALRSVQYRNTDAITAIGGLRVANFSVTDGTTASNTVSRNIVVNAQLNAPAALPYVEDFETSGEGLRYASDTWLNSSGCLGFLRTNQNPYVCTPVTFGNISGSYYWYSEGTSNGANPNPVDIGTLTLAPVNASTYNNLHFNIRMATGQSAQWETDDFVKLYYRVNGGSWVLFSAFYGNGTPSLPGELQRDTDLNGVADGVILNSTMQNVDLVLPAAVTGASVDFQILVDSDGQEEFAFDRINITGTLVQLAPTVTTAAATSTTINSSVLGGNVTADGGATVTTRGVVYSSTNTTPAVGGSGVTLNDNGSGTGSFSETITPLTPGTLYYVRAYATNSVGTSYGAVITFTTSAITVSPATLPAGTVAVAYSQTLTASGGTAPYAYAITAGALPAGLTLSSAGVLSGTPTAGGSFSFTVRATDASATPGPYNGSQAYTLSISTPIIAVNPATLPAGAIASAYSQTITATGGTAPYSYAITAGALPAGLSLSAGGVLSGTPTAGGSFTFTVTATDASTGSGPYSGSRSYTLSIAAPTVAVSPATLPNGATSTVYSQTVTASGGTAPYSYIITAGALPAGLGLASNGTLSGTPTASGSFTFTVTATDASTGSGPYSGSRSYTVTIINTATTVTSVTRLTPSPTATAQVSYRVVFAASVTGVSTSNFSVTPLTGSITGASVSSANGSGTTYTVVVNTGTGNGTLRLDVANGTGISPSVSNTPYTAGEVYTITKSFAAAPQLTIQGTGGTGSDVTAFVDVVQVLSGGSPFANGLQNGSFETHAALANGNYGYNPTGAIWTFNAQSGIAEAGSDFTPVTPIPNGIAVALVQSNGGGNGQLQQNLAVPTGTSYQVRFQAAQRVCCTTLDQSLNVFLNGVFIGNIQPPSASSYNTFTSATFAVTAPALTATVSTTSSSPTSTSPIPFSVSFSQSVGTTFTASDVTVANGTVNTGSFSGSGSGPYTFTVTPTGAGTVTVSLAGGVAFDANNTPNTASNSVSVLYQAPTLTISPATLPGGTVAAAYSQTITATGGTAPYTYAITAGALPAGLTLTSGGVLSGTPTVGGSFTFTVTASDASATPGPFSGSRSYTISIGAPTITLSPATLPAGTVAAAYSQTVTASGGTAPYTYAITAGALPAGLTLSSAGVLAGTPTAGGSFSFTVTAADASTGSGPYSGSRSYSLSIAAPTIAVAPATLPDGTVAAAYSQTVTASGGTAPYAYAITAGALPAGLTLASGGVLSGTPTASGSFTFTVTATDASTGSGPYSGSRSYTITIAAPAAITWTGASSTDWFTAGNWSPNAVPTATTDATIPAGVPRYPAITAGTATAKALTMNSGSSLAQSGGTLDVRANLTNNGAFSATGGTVVLGTTFQSNGPNILGSSNTRFWNLTVNSNGVQLSTSATTSVQRLLTLNGALVTQANPFVLESNAAGTALVVNNSGGFVFGTATVQRYIDPSLNSGLGYRHYSSPVQSTTVTDLTTPGFSPVINPNYNTFGSAVTPFPTVFGFDESRIVGTNATTQDFTYGYFSPTSLTSTLTSGRGYTVNLNASQKVDLVGALNNGAVSVGALSRGPQPNSGWHLLGNPYPAPLDWNVARTGLPTGVIDAVYVYKSQDQYNGSYQFYQNGFGTLPGGLIGSMQGFFVRVSQPVAAFSFANAWRLTAYQNPTFNRTTAETRPAVQLDLVDAQGRHEAAFVYFENGATTGLDDHYDAAKLPNTTGLNLSSIAAGANLAVNGLPELNQTTVTVPLAVQVPTSGTYTLAAAQLLNLAGTPVYLRDRQQGTLTDLALQPNYAFMLNAANTNPRFELVFGLTQVLGTASATLGQQVALYPNPAHSVLNIELPASLSRQAVTAALVDALGRVVYTQELPASAVARVLPLTNIATGVYSLRLNTAAGVVVKKLVVE